MVFSKLEYPLAIIQTATQSSYFDAFKGRYYRLIEGIVLRNYFVDERKNFSSRWSHDQGVEGKGSDLVDANVDGTLRPLFAYPTGFRVECDVLLTATSHRDSQYTEIFRVPVMMRGGIADQDLWVPRPSSTYRLDRDLNPDKLDGDVVLIQCIGGVFPKGAIIIGMAPHPWNFRDAPRSVRGDRELPKSVGDGLRKDGRVRLTRYNGAVCPFIDRFGNILFDTTEANRQDSLDIDSGRHVVVQDNVPWTAGATETAITEVPSPGGGDIVFRIKNSRRFRIEFNDNQEPKRDIFKANPPEYAETGYIQVHQDDAGNRVLNVSASDNMVINVKKVGSGSGSLTINAEGAVTINSNVASEGITLGGSLLDRFATKEFVEGLFLAHVHAITGPTNTGPPVVGGIPVGPTVNSATGTVSTHPLVKVVSTKVRGE